LGHGVDEYNTHNEHLTNNSQNSAWYADDSLLSLFIADIKATIVVLNFRRYSCC